jgi:hypothetical protein
MAHIAILLASVLLKIISRLKAKSMAIFKGHSSVRARLGQSRLFFNLTKMNPLAGVVIGATICASLEASAKDYPFVGRWGEYFTRAPEGCSDTEKTFEVTSTEISGCKIKKIEKQGIWYIVTSRCSDGTTSKEALHVDGDELTMQAVTEPETRSTSFTYPRCQ